MADLQIKPYDAMFAPAPATTRGQATVLAVDEKVGTEAPCVFRSASTTLCAMPLQAGSVGRRQPREQSSKREQTAPAASPVSTPFLTARLVSFQRLHVRAANAIAVEQGGNLLYGSGRSVVIRNIADPNQAELFTEHAKDVTVAKVCDLAVRVREAVPFCLRWRLCFCAYWGLKVILNHDTKDENKTCD